MSTRAWARLVVVALGGAAIAAGAWSCGDPVHNAQVAALGDEPGGGSPGPAHRPGQPCLTCHGGLGPANLELSVGGTIFATAQPSSPGLGGAVVTVYDATEALDGGAPHTAVTNSAGNFFFLRSAWSPYYALHDINVTYAGATTHMQSNVGRDGSCATCHFDPKGNGTNGHVYLVLEPADLPATGMTP